MLWKNFLCTGGNMTISKGMISSFEKTLTAFIGEITKITEIAGEEVAYTLPKKDEGDPIRVFLNTTHGMLIEVDFPELMSFGWCIHESLHQIFTDFEAMEKMRQKLAVENRLMGELYCLVRNIFEDSYIEMHCDDVYGPSAVKSLEYAIKEGWRLSPDITLTMDTFDQIIAALIQIGDLGKYKGEINEEAKGYLKKILPLFQESIVADHDGVCVKNSAEATRILFDLFKASEEEAKERRKRLDEMMKETPELGMPQKTGKGRSSSSKKDSKSPLTESLSETMDKMGDKGSDSESSGKSSSDETPDAEGSCSDEGSGGSSSKKSETSSDSDSSGKSTGSKPSESGADSDSGSGKKPSEDPSEEDIEDLKKVLESLKEDAKKEERKLKNAEKADKRDTSPLHEGKPMPFAPKGVNNLRVTGGDEPLYDKITKEYSVVINSLSSSIQYALKTKKGGKMHTDNGKINITRYYSPTYKGNRVFDKKKLNQTVDAAFMILVDQSGSMGCDKRMKTAMETAVILTEALSRAKVPVYVMGYSADEGLNGNCVHRHFCTWNTSKKDKVTLTELNPHVENRDGPSICYASEILAKRNEMKKFMIVISDGMPSASNYRGYEAIKDTKRAVQTARREFDLLGVCITETEEEVLREIYDGFFLSVESLKDLPKELVKKINTMIRSW